MNEIRMYEPSDYELACNLWFANEKVPVEEKLLSPIGAFYCIDKVPVAMGFLYLFLGCKLGEIEFLVTNPVASAMQRAVAIRSLIGFALEYARNEGYDCVKTAVHDERLARYYTKLGFVRQPHSFTIMVRRWE